ncbi:MAG: site-specific integrase [Acidobacteriota bacterium]
MGINRVTKRGKTRIELRKRWPDGQTLRRYFPNRTIARQVLNEIEVSIARGTWSEYRATLERPQRLAEPERVMTIADLAPVYLDEYCRIYNRRPDFKEQALSSIVRILGSVELPAFARRHGDRFVSTRVKEVTPATVNRGIAVLRNMLRFAVKKGYIESNPLTDFGKLPEEEMPLRILTLAEERSLVEAIAAESHLVGVYVALLGETGLRKSEGLRLKWEHLDLPKRMLTVEQSKSAHPRYVPLSPYALEWLMTLSRDLRSPWVFTRPGTGRPVKDPRVPFFKGRESAGLKWVRGFHCLRHFRATMWLQRGVDIHTVQKYLGHLRIETTMRYLHFVEDYAERSIRRAQEAEHRESEQLRRGRHLGDTPLEAQSLSNGGRL